MRVPFHLHRQSSPSSVGLATLIGGLGAWLLGCGFRTSELVSLELDEIQIRQGHWAVVDLIGKAGTSAQCPFHDGSKRHSISG